VTYVFARHRFLLLVLTVFAFAMPALADDVTISGTVNFSSLDGSSLDHDGAANGVFTVDDGNLTVLGTINCLDDGPGNNSACPMAFAVSGNFTMAPGSAIFAENRRGGGTGGNITINAGGNVSLQSTGPLFLDGAVISSGNEGTPAAGNITINADGTSNFAAGTAVSAASKGGNAGAIHIESAGVYVNGLIASAPSRVPTLASRYTGDVVSGGSSNAKGGTITVRSNSNSEPGVVIDGYATIVSQGEGAGSSRVLVEGCGIEIRGLVASVAKGGTTSAVSVRSGTTLLVDTRDLVLAVPANSRFGVLRADSTQGSAATYRVDLFAQEGIQVLGAPAASPFFSVTSNPGGNNATGGSIRVISTGSTVTASGNAFRAGDTANGDNGGSISVSAQGNVTLDTATIRANGGNNGKGGAISVRSHSGGISWQNGVGDARPTGSAIAASKRGTIALTYCTTVNTAGSSFPTNGAPVGPYPTTATACSPAAPSLPVGETLPDCNDAPVAVNDAYTVAEGGTLNVAPPGVLTNDTDADGDPITAVLVSGPAHATSFTLNANGSFNYVHNGSETTTDSFTYVANDGSLSSNTATVFITITPVNDPPVANNDSYTVAEGGTINFAAPGVLVNDTDPDGPALTAILVSGPAHASFFVLNPDGSFQYVHNGSETTSDSFTYRASDGTLLSNIATASITITPVNDAPVANNDAYNVNEGGTLTVPAPGVLVNDTDAEGNSLSAVLVSGPANAASFTLNADGSFSYQHNGSETTSDSFTYRANDGAANSNIATVNITVNAVNDAPVANDDGPYNVNEGGTLNVAAPGVLGNDTDAENNTLNAVLVSGPSNAASFTLNANGSFSYQHDGSETTSDSFTYMANDGTANSNVATVTITITPVNDAPVANNDGPYTVAEGGTLNEPAPGVLANDTDAEGSSLTAVLVSGPANASSFTLNADGSFTYVHNGGETTSDSFTYMANDGAANSNIATVSITITGVNDAPVAVDDGPYSVAEGGTFNLPAPGVLGNDTDAENDTLNAVLVSGPSNAASFTLNPDGSFSYQHNGSETTSDSFTYMANDGTANSNVATVTITITPVNDAPVAVDDAYNVNEGGTLNVPAPGVLVNDTDAENNSLSAVLVSGPSNAASFTLNADGSFNYVHNGSETLTDSFTYRANDGTSNSNIATVTITIAPVNDAPVANNDSYNVTFHGTINVPAPGVLGNDTDAEGNTMTAILVTNVTQGTLILNADGSFQYTHTGPSLGTDSFTYIAQDSLGAQSAPATVTINIINLAPTAADDSYLGVGNTELRVGTGPAAHPAAVVSGSVLANDTDVDGGPSPLTVTAFDATSANGGTVTMLPNGTFNYLPPTGFTGIDTFNYTVSDGIASDVGTVSVNMIERVWYVNPVAAGPQTGRSTDPFMTIGQAQAASAVNDWIHVAQGAQSTGILLKDGQRLIGSGVPLVVGSYTLAPATTRPTLAGTILLADGNEVAGLNVTAIGTGITGNAVAGGTIREVGISGGTDGLSLTNATGAFTLTNVSVAPGNVGVTISGGTANVTANNLNVVTSGATGILGNGTGTLAFNAGSVLTSNGVAVNLTNHVLGGSGLTSVTASNSVNGIVLTSTGGTFSVAGAGVAGSGGSITGMNRGVLATNAAGVSLSWMNINNSAQQGVLATTNLATATSLNVQSSSFSNNFSNAVQTANTGSGTQTVDVGGSTFTTNNAAVVIQTTVGPVVTHVTGNTATFSASTPFVLTRNSTGTGTVNATFTGNNVGTTGVPGSGTNCGGSCGGINVQASGTNQFNLLVSNNTIRNVDGFGIRAIANSGSSQMNVHITNNIVAEPGPLPIFGINVQSGASAADTTAVCTTITGNTVTGGFSPHIAVRNAVANSLFKLPGYAGSPTDTTAVANFLIANNTITTATATRKVTVPANQFDPGPPCPTPAP
jgi:large repetitive protein